MSGFNPTTGVFEITSKKVDYWLQREPTKEDLEALSKEGFDGYDTMQVAVFLFRKFGYEIVKKGSGYIRVKATPEQVWEVLSGTPSDPQRAQHYYENPAPGS